jgi:hypothetical protein
MLRQRLQVLITSLVIYNKFAAVSELSVTDTKFSPHPPTRTQSPRAMSCIRRLVTAVEAHIQPQQPRRLLALREGRPALLSRTATRAGIAVMAEAVCRADSIAR